MVNEAKTQIKKRIWEIDFLRGIAIFLMILDHFVYDLATFESFFSNHEIINNSFMNQMIKFAITVNSSDARWFFHCFFVGVFFVLSGISSAFSKNNLKRGFLILGTCVVLDLATYLIYYISGKSIDVRMVFNVLLPLGLGVLLLAFIRKIPYSKYICLNLGVLIILIGFIFNLYSQVAFEDELSLNIIPSILISKAAFGSDCFGIIPYIGFIFLGSFIGDTIYKNKKSLIEGLDGKWNKFFCFIGRKTIWIYLVHQVILAIVVGAIFLCFGYRF